MTEIAAGALGGFVLGSFVRQRFGIMLPSSVSVRTAICVPRLCIVCSFVVVRVTACAMCYHTGSCKLVCEEEQSCSSLHTNLNEPRHMAVCRVLQCVVGAVDEVTT